MTNAERVVAVSLLGALLVPFAALAQPAASRVDLAEHHEFVIESFRTESGVTLPQARIVYGTYGHLNAARNNAVLLPSHYMADHHGYEWIIGPGACSIPGAISSWRPSSSATATRRLRATRRSRIMGRASPS